MNHRRGVTLVVLAGIAAVGQWACDLTQKASSTRLAAATVLASPPYALTVSFDGGVFDAGALPSQVAAALFLGERMSTLDELPKGLTGGKVTLSFANQNLTLGDKGSGNYALDSVQDKNLVYTPGAVYTFRIIHGEAYSGAVTAGPQETVAQFHPNPLGPISHSANQSLTLTRKALAAGQGRDPAFTVVYPLGAGNDKGQPTYSDVPQDARALLDFVVNDAKWKGDTITIPGSAFPQAASRYLVAVTAVRKGTQEQFSSNLFIGSAFVAGTADLGLVETK